MTKSINFPHKVYARRVSALERLQTNLVTWQKIQADPSNGAMFNMSKIPGHIRRIEREIAVLESRTKGGGGRKSTKKVHANTGRM